MKYLKSTFVGLLALTAASSNAFAFGPPGPPAGGPPAGGPPMGGPPMGGGLPGGGPPGFPGGGLAGLATASALGRAGYEVDLFESRPFLGGRATWQDAIPVYAREGAEALSLWLEERGAQNIQALNNVLARSAIPWWDCYGGKDNIEVIELDYPVRI